MNDTTVKLPEYFYITRHLSRRFRHAREYQATVLLAPDGFGKTTSVQYYLLDQNYRYFWVDFSRGEECAWQMFLNEIFGGQKRGRLYDAPFRLSFEGKLELFHEILSQGGSGKAAIIFDHFEGGRSKASERFVEYMIDNMPENWHIFLMDNGQLRAKAHQWMGKMNVQVLGEDDLKFHVEDIYRYFSQYRLEVSIEELMGLFELSKGSVGEIRKILTAQTRKIDRFSTLSEREMEIAECAAAGLTNRQIGERLYISENTVKSALKIIFEKLGIHSRRSLIHLFHREDNPLVGRFDTADR